jgi:hypothetical protein
MNDSKVLFVACSLIIGCSTDDKLATSNTEQEALSGPTITKAGDSWAMVISSSPEVGLYINGSTQLGAFLIATYDLDSSLTDATGSFTVTPAVDAAFVYTLRGSGTGYSGKQLRLQRRPGSDQLEAAASTGSVSCGVIASGTATPVTLQFNAASHTFTVLINGASSMCTSLPTKLQPPIVGFHLMDASNEDWGGEVEFRNLTLQPPVL